MESTETDLDLTLTAIQKLSVSAREVIKGLTNVCSPLLIVEAANILEDIERLEGCYLGELFLHELEAEFTGKDKTDAV